MMTKREIPKPKKPHTGCTCNCRADVDKNIPGNMGKQIFAIGTATAHNCAEASKLAKRNATKQLGGAQPKHLPCKCSGKNDK